MSLTFTVYHTCHLEGSLNTIFNDSPYKCDPNQQQWLGVGYYFWTDCDYFAHLWGKRDDKYPKGYAITEYEVDIPEESFLDLVGNVKDQLFFKEQILEYVKKMGIELKSKEEARNIPVSKVIDHLRASLPNNESACRYDAIRAMDYSAKNSYKFTENRNERIPIPSRQQLFLKDLSFLRIKRLFCAKRLKASKYQPVRFEKKDYIHKYHLGGANEQ